MAFQKKIYPCFDKEFWKDITLSISYLIRDLITGRDIARIARALREAGIVKCSDSLLYKWANPHDDATPSLKAFLLLVKICEDCGPIASINEACGSIGVPDNDFQEAVSCLLAEYEKRNK